MQPRSPLVGMAWRPERGFGAYDYKGYDEAMVLYILGLLLTDISYTLVDPRIRLE